ncbi:MAG: amidase, partial [Planctomycetia bacterium]|nr:amidase [Planctomycetia bacterium]
MSDLHWLGVVELAEAIARKAVSPVEVVKALLARIEKLDGQLKSFIGVFADEALAAARQAEAAVMAGDKLGSLHGVPVALKDLYDVQGSLTTGGWKFAVEAARRDCTVVTKLRAAGAIILGKLNLHPFAYGPEGLNPHFGNAWNPWDTTTHRMAGGSSSGSGVAVAAGLAPMGMGSDTSGSI